MKRTHFSEHRDFRGGVFKRINLILKRFDISRATNEEEFLE